MATDVEGRDQMKANRNDPCPCGSGKKLKKCCLVPPPLSSEDRLVEEIRAGRDDLFARLMRYVRQHYGPLLFECASTEFMGADNELPEEADVASLLVPHALFHWTNDPFSNPQAAPISMRNPLAIEFLAEYQDRLSKLQVQFIETVMRTPYCFHEIIECSPGQGLLVRNVLTDRQLAVMERSGSATMKPGDILFGQVLEIENVCLLEGFANFTFPPRAQLDLLDLRARLEQLNEMALNDSILFMRAAEIRAAFWELSRRLWHPALPNLCNTDGDPICFCRVIYAITDIEAVVQCLAPLATNETLEEILARADRKRDGSLASVQLRWVRQEPPENPGLDSTLLGQLALNKDRLTADVNSEKRALRIRELISELAGPLARYLQTVVEPVEGKLRSSRSSPSARKEQEELNRRPEVRAMLRDLRRKHMMGWIAEPIPALDHLTPLEAVKNPRDRRKVEALLDDFERGDERHDPDNVDPDLYQEVRARLGPPPGDANAPVQRRPAQRTVRCNRLLAGLLHLTGVTAQQEATAPRRAWRHGSISGTRALG